MTASVELHGNAYAVINRRTSDNGITSLVPVNPSHVQVNRDNNGEISYTVNENGRSRSYFNREILHIRGPFGDGLKGESTLSSCSSVFQGAALTNSASSSVFANGIRPSGILTTESNITLSKEQREEFEQILAEKFKGSMNAGRPMLLDRGMKWQQLTITPEDAQMLDSRKFSGEEICRIFGVPPAMVGYGDKASNWGTGKEVDVTGFVKFTLRKRLKRFEQALLKQLVPIEERRAGNITIEFNIDGLLRGDTEARYEAYEKGIRMGIITRNEARKRENLPPIEGGDVVTVQMQDVPLANALKGDTDNAA